MKSKESIIKSAATLCLVTLLAFSAVVLIKGWISGSFRSVESLRVYVASFGIWAPVVLMLIQLFLTILPICTSFAGCVVGAALFGAAGGYWINYIGICAGSLVAYTLARCFGIRMVERMISLDKYEHYIEKVNLSKSYPKLLFLAILLPMAPDNFLCYFSGLVNLSPKKFTAIILAAKPWCILVYSIFFAYFI
jgi:uncharacterized membrane protein YdjX (TVP38/TMEM64 family)